MKPMADQKNPETWTVSTLEELARLFEREILNAFTVRRDTSLADGAGAPGSTAAGNNRSGMHDADERRGKRD